MLVAEKSKSDSGKELTALEKSKSDSGKEPTAYVFTEANASYGIGDGQSTVATLWFDYDGDDDLDLVTIPDYNSADDVALYRNDGDEFVNVAEAVGLAGLNIKGFVSVADYDNDGDTDTMANVNLFRNDISENGQFTFVEKYGRSFVDYDNDGDLDLFGRGWGTPGKLYQNDAGVFTEVDGALGLNSVLGHIRSLNWADYDDDGDMDLLIVNGRWEKATLYRNDLNTSGIFSDVTDAMGLSQAGVTGYTDGAAWGDYDNDGDLDFYIAAEHGTGNRLYRNDGDVFTDVTADAGIRNTDGRHADWGDYDNDGDLDLYVCTVRNPNRLYRNELSEGNGFVFVETGEMAETHTASAGSWGDFDGDGDIDYYMGSG